LSRSLEHLIATLPIPGHPPRYLRVGAEYGTAFFDMALRQNHLRRLTERLQLFDVANMARTVTLDLSLDRLSTSQLEAARRYNAVRRRPSADRSSDAGNQGEPDLAWVVIARVPRADTAPVAVYDADGRAVPHLTQEESRDLLNAALYRVLRMILEAHPQASLPDDALHRFLHVDNRARWLVQHAIGKLVETGALHLPPDERGGARPAWLSELAAFHDHTVATLDGRPPPPDSAAAIRAEARSILAQHIAGQSAFFELLDLAASDYLLVVGLNAARAEHVLTFEGPLLSAGAKAPVRKRLHQVLNALPWSSQELVVEYRSRLPPGIHSYHLSIEVDPSVKCRRFLHRTDADRPIGDAAVADLLAVAEHLDECDLEAEVPERRLVEYELQWALQRVGWLVQARVEDFRRYRAYLGGGDLNGSKHGEPKPAAGPESEPAEPTTFRDLELLVDEHSEGRLTRLFDTGRGEGPPAPTLFRNPARIRGLAGLIERCQLGDDATADNDPRENGAHAYWRRRRWPGARSSGEGFLSVVRFTLADDAPSLFGSVVRLIGVLVATLYVLFSFLFRTPWWIWNGGDELTVTPEADALIAVLLLVPGLLLARLDLPSTNTVVGYLRSAPRALAFTSFGVMLLVAVATAADLKQDDAVPIWARIGLCVLLACFLLAVVGSVRARLRRQATGLDVLSPPRWLSELIRQAPVDRPADVVFMAAAAAAPRRREGS
jgi:hypothetical protein